MAAVSPRTDGLIGPDDTTCRRPQRRHGDVQEDWSKLAIRQVDSNRMVESLRNGICICDDMDELPGDSFKHPLCRVHHEQLLRQRPRSQRLCGPPDAPHMRFEPVYEEERFCKNSKKYGYQVKYLCDTCKSEWELIHDYWWSTGSNEPVTGCEGGYTDAVVEGVKVYRTLAGSAIF
mmetsp:Transcript_47844/g.126648  ORF Transcript_47844/g.126648 Transcript_47844/m.126648 type:complete len:176 (-) Transcript_47844:132-659(-)